MDKPSVYIETSIVSYLAADPSRHPVTLRNQQLTHEWWSTHRHRYALYTSAVTLLEAGRGNPSLVRKRLALLAHIPLVTMPTATGLPDALRVGIPLPARASPDAEHIAIAASNGLSFLLTWDRKHIANPRLWPRMQAVFSRWGYTPPVFCSPGELLGR